jgi:ABC-type glycerol-3-phosphate transport system substrate-binding protein
MLGSQRPWLSLVLVLLFVLVAMLLGGCDLLPATPTPQPDGGPGGADETPVSPGPTPGPTSVQTTPGSPAVMTLTMWTTESFSPTQVLTSGQILAAEVAAFEADHPDVRLEFLLKAPYGRGGILDYLLVAPPVVPELLPDLAVIDVDELPTAVQAGVLQPLDNQVSPELVADLYPFARQATSFDGQLWGLQYRAGFNHLVYNTGQLTVPPRSWPGVLSSPGIYAFPAGGQSGLVNDSFLVQYLAVHPWPLDSDPDAPFLDVDSLTAVLQFYQDGVSRGVFAPEILDYHTVDDCWSAYVVGEADLAHVSAHRYQLEGDALPNAAVAPIPSINGAGPPITQGWALVLITSDPERQALAVELMARWMAVETNANWNRAAGYLPTRQTATLALSEAAEAGEEASYLRFVDQQLQAAQPRPRLPNYAQVAAALQEAIDDVVSGVAMPEEAAARLVDNSP